MEVSVHDSYTLIACGSALQPLELFAIEIPRPQWSGEHFAYTRGPRHARPRALKSAAKRRGTTHSPTAARRHRSRCQGSPQAPLKVRTMHARAPDLLDNTNRHTSGSFTLACRTRSRQIRSNHKQSLLHTGALLLKTSIAHSSALEQLRDLGTGLPAPQSAGEQVSHRGSPCRVLAGNS
jgi:hypothetical protein